MDNLGWVFTPCLTIKGIFNVFFKFLRDLKCCSQAIKAHGK